MALKEESVQQIATGKSVRIIKENLKEILLYKSIRTLDFSAIKN